MELEESEGLKLHSHVLFRMIHCLIFGPSRFFHPNDVYDWVDRLRSLQRQPLSL